MKAVYEEIQERLKDQEAVTEGRLKREREMYAHGEEALRKMEERPEIRFKERIKRDLIDINEAIIRKVKEAKKAGKDISGQEVEYETERKPTGIATSTPQGHISPSRGIHACRCSQDGRS